MRHGAGPGRTRDDHLDVAAQLLAALARARQVRELAELVGAAALSATDRRYLAFEERSSRDFVDQRRDERRDLDETLDRAWRALAVLPRRELTMLPAALLDAHLAARRRTVTGSAAGAARPGRAAVAARPAAVRPAARPSLLDRKLPILRGEQQRLRLRAERTRRPVARVLARGRPVGLRAALVGGERELRLSAPAGPRRGQVAWAHRRWGCATRPGPMPRSAAVARRPRSRAPPRSSRRPTPTGARSGGRARRRRRRVRLIDAEVAATRRRLRAITDRWLPRLESLAPGSPGSSTRPSGRRRSGCAGPDPARTPAPAGRRPRVIVRCGLPVVLLRRRRRLDAGLGPGKDDGLAPAVQPPNLVGRRAVRMADADDHPDPSGHAQPNAFDHETITHVRSHHEPPSSAVASSRSTITPGSAPLQGRKSPPSNNTHSRPVHISVERAGDGARYAVPDRDGE